VAAIGFVLQQFSSVAIVQSVAENVSDTAVLREYSLGMTEPGPARRVLASASETQSGSSPSRVGDSIQFR
jgi:hypothetical protein